MEKSTLGTIIFWLALLATTGLGLMLWIFAAASESNFARPGLGTYGVPAILAAYFLGALISWFWVSRQIGFWVAVLPAVLVVIMVFLMAIFKGFKSGLNK